jgi:hypothetical protein
MTRNGHEANAVPDRWRALERVVVRNRAGTVIHPTCRISDRLGSEIRFKSSPARACTRPLFVRHYGHQLDRSRGKGPL